MDAPAAVPTVTAAAAAAASVEEAPMSVAVLGFMSHHQQQTTTMTTQSPPPTAQQHPATNCRSSSFDSACSTETEVTTASHNNNQNKDRKQAARDDMTTSKPFVPEVGASAEPEVIDLLDTDSSSDDGDDVVVVLPSKQTSIKDRQKTDPPQPATTTQANVKQHRTENRDSSERSVAAAAAAAAAKVDSSDDDDDANENCHLLKQVQDICPDSSPSEIRRLLTFYGPDRLDLVVLGLTEKKVAPPQQEVPKKASKKRARQDAEGTAARNKAQKLASLQAADQVLQALPMTKKPKRKHVRRLLRKNAMNVEVVIDELLTTHNKTTATTTTRKPKATSVAVSGAAKPAPAVVGVTASSDPSQQQQQPSLTDLSLPSSLNDFELVVRVCKELDRLLEDLLKLLEKDSKRKATKPNDDTSSSSRPQTLGLKVGNVQRFNVLSEDSILYLGRLTKIRNRLVHDASKTELSEGERFEFREGYDLVKREILDVQRQQQQEGRQV